MKRIEYLAYRPFLNFLRQSIGEILVFYTHVPRVIPSFRVKTLAFGDFGTRIGLGQLRMLRSNQLRHEARNRSCAGSENRTRVPSLARTYSTTKPYPPSPNPLDDRGDYSRKWKLGNSITGNISQTWCTRQDSNPQQRFRRPL